MAQSRVACRRGRGRDLTVQGVVGLTEPVACGREGVEDFELDQADAGDEGSEHLRDAVIDRASDDERNALPSDSCLRLP